MKATAKKGSSKRNGKILLSQKSAEEILDGLKVTQAERRLARAVVDAVTKRSTAPTK